MTLIILPLAFSAQACNLLGPSTPPGARGVFASVDSGETWALGKSGKNFSLAGAPVNRLFIEGDKPHNILAAGTLSGALASQDYGKTWSVLLPGVVASDVFINPNNDEELFAGGTKNGLAAIFKSPDRGAAWVQVYNEPVDKVTVTSLAFDRLNGRQMYAGLSSGTVLSSTDGGNKWTALTDFPNRVMDLAVGRGVIYVLTARNLQRSADSGKTWTEIKINLPRDKTGNFNAMYMDNIDNGYIIIAAANGLFITRDSGSSWAKLGLPSAPEISNVTAVNVNPSKRSQIFAAIRSTVYRSDDSGVTWKTSKLPTQKTIFDLAIDPFEPNRVYAGLK